MKTHVHTRAYTYKYLCTKRRFFGIDKLKPLRADSTCKHGIETYSHRPVSVCVCSCVCVCVYVCKVSRVIDTDLYI